MSFLYYPNSRQRAPDCFFHKWEIAGTDSRYFETTLVCAKCGRQRRRELRPGDEQKAQEHRDAFHRKMRIRQLQQELKSRLWEKPPNRERMKSIRAEIKALRSK